MVVVCADRPGCPAGSACLFLLRKGEADVSDETVQLEALDMDELLARLEGGMFSLFTGDEQYADMVKIAAALGLKDFVETRMRGRDRTELLPMFADGEQVISEFLQHAANKGLLEVQEEAEED